MVGFSFLRTWLARPEQGMATLLLGNTVANIGASAMATAIFERYVHPAVAVATGVMTLLILYLSEITPKTFAKGARRVGGAAHPPTHRGLLLGALAPSVTHCSS